MLTHINEGSITERHSVGITDRHKHRTQPKQINTLMSIQNTARNAADNSSKAKAVWFAVLVHLALFGLVATQGDQIEALQQDIQETVQPDATTNSDEVADL